VIPGIGKFEELLKANTKAQQENTAEMRKLNEALAQFREDAQVIMASVQGMGGAGALMQAMGPISGMLGKLLQQRGRQG
jgi:hypothetical protein